jgi:hypothetical protein
MDRLRLTRELDDLNGHSGRVVSGVLSEVGAIPVANQDPALVAQVLACARVIDDPESFSVAPQAFVRLARLLDACHEGVGGD